MGVHDGHRDRVRDKFIKNGFDGMQEHEILEMVLFYCVPRKDTNEIAHNLINKYGNLASVLEAEYDSLIEVEGITKSSAVYLTMFLKLMREYDIISEKNSRKIFNANQSGEFFLKRYRGLKEEMVSAVCLDSKQNIISYEEICKGDVSQVGFDIRKIVNFLIKNKSSMVIVAHNHPSGFALPSNEDIKATLMLRDTLLRFNTTLLDHIIIANDDFISMASSRNFSEIFLDK